jgi:hypothetical protein
MGLGSYPEVSLAEARRVRGKALALVRGGIDPIEERERQNAGASAVAPSFDDCAKLYIAAHEPSWRNARHRQQWTNTLRDYASPAFGSMPVEAIPLERILEALTPLWLKTPVTASRVSETAALRRGRSRLCRPDPADVRWRTAKSGLLHFPAGERSWLSTIDPPLNPANIRRQARLKSASTAHRSAKTHSCSQFQFLPAKQSLSYCQRRRIYEF